MKKNKMIAAAIFTFALLTTTFAMSGGGNNEPAKQAQEVKQDVQNIQPEQLDQPDQVKSNDSFKDQYGINTGMTKEEFDDFKETYLKRFKTNALFNSKIDCDKYIELKQLGVDFSKFGVITNTLYQNNTLFSDIIIIGKTVKRDKGLGLLEIEEILKGDDIMMNKLGEIPTSIYYGYGDGGVGFTDPVVGERGLYFFAAAYALSKERPYLQRKAESTTILNVYDTMALHEDLYGTSKDRLESLKKQAEAGNKNNSYIFKTFDEVVENVKKIIEVNDHKNFYKKSFKPGGKK